MNVIAEIKRINAAELESGTVGTPASWHSKYAESAWCYAGNLPIALTEGDVICVMSQFGEIEDLHLVRDEETGKSKGFCFVKYEDARSCVLAVDNFCGSTILGRSIRVDHVEQYRLPKHLLEKEEELARTGPGHAYHGTELANQYDINKGQDLFAPPVKSPENDDAASPYNINDEDNKHTMTKEERREAKQKRKEARDAKRREKEEKRMKKEERRREKRARKYKEKGSESEEDYQRKRQRTKRHHQDDGQNQGNAKDRRSDRYLEEKGRERQRKKKRRRSRSRSTSSRSPSPKATRA
mmetsp:Transcript_1390/g.2196  ORF Transcript_1390/g.2196 Transcript_1390/m.2196 type:complete len:297 (+) Transcript_1390:203-1093(+)|eukprot:CAMPEP_0195304114 /NCGR_PEP_ID=MMETSP0707-20130614/33878_1 /TAXON_ID=33640 /ORGANISM="Asterionellopsis glacialis, Strain CCMP134" /LENGTH=296 /DNA_ID=CAMNT_0040367831 /DNA_START=196 /DNA_END=1086 /DNA_ORIENTATION=+